ncbi:hypothetical protein [Streptomyces sp. NPDC086182]|uniref:hypothetical protein n=1 Tax=Streptomyces sp. NPDC086182 TaxID=3155058 RepID=UPI00342E53C9
MNMRRTRGRCATGPSLAEFRWSRYRYGVPVLPPALGYGWGWGYGWSWGWG